MKTCKLCHTEVSKLSKSHIIPKFVYTKSGIVRDNQGGMFDFKTGRIIKRPVGEYDTDLMCASCEGMVNDLYENYAKSLFYDGFGDPSIITTKRIEHATEGSILNYSGVDYHKLKSYLMLNLWRAATTSRQFFQRVSLNEDDAELIRTKLLMNEPFAENEFVISIHSYEYSQQLPPIITQPGSAKGLHMFIVGKSIYMYYRDFQSAPDNMVLYTPKENGEFGIQMIPEERATELINKYHGTKLF